MSTTSIFSIDNSYVLFSIDHERLFYELSLSYVLSHGFLLFMHLIRRLNVRDLFLSFVSREFLLFFGFDFGLKSLFFLLLHLHDVNFSVEKDVVRRAGRTPEPEQTPSSIYC